MHPCFSGAKKMRLLAKSHQDLSAERGFLEQQKQDLEAVLLTAKLQAPTGSRVFFILPRTRDLNPSFGVEHGPREVVEGKIHSKPKD